VFLLTYYLQEGLGLAALATGLVFAPLGLGFALRSATGARLALRRGLAVPAAGIGVVVAALGCIALVDVIAAAEHRPWLVAATLLVAGLGQGATTNPVIALTLDAVPRSGAASGVLLTVTQLANILGITLIGSLFFALLGAVGRFSRALDWSLLPLAGMFGAVLLVLPRLRNLSPGPALDDDAVERRTGESQDT
jgi:MFS family permease